MKIDAGVSQLVQAMASFSSAHAGFDPTTATQAPSDAGLADHHCGQLARLSQGIVRKQTPRPLKRPRRFALQLQERARLR